MKQTIALALLLLFFFTGSVQAQNSQQKTSTTPRYFMDVHHTAPGKVTAADVAGAHAKDLATQSKYGVRFLKYWVDEKAGDIYCLSSALDSAGVVATHREAHGLLPQEMHEVEPGTEALTNSQQRYFLDIHRLEPGKVKAADVEKAHQKDLAVQNKYGVHFINYWVDEKAGVVYCLSQARDSASVTQTHKEAHGLLPAAVVNVQQGQ